LALVYGVYTYVYAVDQEGVAMRSLAESTAEVAVVTPTTRLVINVRFVAPRLVGILRCHPT
jgi:hypothetical protein